jgi:acyl-[acyl carrier protein]--UDP-N-acetylglucosamine O-acyltransferase
MKMTIEEIYAIPADPGGWRILPNGNRLHIGPGVTAEIDLAEIGSDAEIGSGAEIGSDAKIGSYAKIGSGAKIGSDAEIGSYAKIGSDAEIGSYAKIGSDAEIGSYAKIGSGAKIGSDAEISDKAVWLKSPLAVQGSRHLAGNYQPGKIQIGCQLHDFQYWSDHVLGIARRAGYTTEEGLEYQRIVAFIVTNGVA